MGEFVVHAGFPGADPRHLQGWLSQNLVELAHDHGVFVHRVRAVPPRPVRENLPVRPGADFRLATVVTGGVDSSLLTTMISDRNRSGDHQGLAEVGRRLVVEAREQLRRFGRVVLSSADLGELLLDREPLLIEALQELTAHHQVRLVAYLQPQHRALEFSWRSTGCRTGMSPSEWCASLGPRLDYWAMYKWVVDLAPDLLFDVRVEADAGARSGASTADFVHRVLGMSELVPVPDATGPFVSLESANLVWRSPPKVLFRGLPDRLVLAQAPQPRPCDDEATDPFRASLAALQQWCHDRFEPGNRELIREAEWSIHELVPLAVGVDAGRGLACLDQAWAPAESPTERKTRIDEWRRQVTPDPITGLQRVQALVLDLGCGRGDTVASAQRRFGAEGVGVDHSVPTVLDAQSRGLAVYAGDIREIEPGDYPEVQYVVLDNVLEHLGTMEDVASVLATACEIALRAVYIRHPSFDEGDALAEVGCKLYWTDWPSDHITPISVEKLSALALQVGGVEVGVVDIDRISGSDDPRVLPLSASPDQYPAPGTKGVYDEVLHGPKLTVEFSFPVHHAHDLVVRTGPGRLVVDYPQSPLDCAKRPTLTWEQTNGPVTVRVDGDDASWALRPTAGGLSSVDHPLVEKKVVESPPPTTQPVPARWDLVEGLLHPRQARLVDLGAGRGQSLIDAQARFGCPGVGIELSGARVQTARGRGLSLYEGDIRTLDPADFPRAEYVNLDNVLEHLPTPDDVEGVLDVAARMARRVVLIRHPSFEDVDYLREMGLKLYWTDWPGTHTAPVRVHELMQMANRRGLYRVVCRPLIRIFDSSDPSVLPIDAPPHQHTDSARQGVYDPTAHGPKPQVMFDLPVFKLFELLLITGDGTPELIDRPGFDLPEIGWSELPGHAPAAWIDQLHGLDPGASRIMVRADDTVVVVEGNLVRAVPSPIVARALQLMFDVEPFVAEEHRGVAPGPPVTALKTPGQSMFVILGGRRHPLPRLPAALYLQSEQAARFELGPPLNVLGASAQLDVERKKKK